MVEKAVFLFPGQGAQYPGMGLDLAKASPAAAEIFSLASSVLGRDMIALIRDSDSETLKRTDISQPALACASLAAAAFLKERGVLPAACAGFSLGEYPALVWAGVITPEDCFHLTDARGRAMQTAVDQIAGKNGGSGMAAVLGLPPERVEALINEWKCEGNTALQELYAANINSPKQTVVSGAAAALEAAALRFKEAGARRVIRLEVAGPFHSPFMKAAAEAFAPELEKTSFADPAIPLFSNVTGRRIQSGGEAKSLALRHIVEGVRWTEEEAAVMELNPEAVLETGPGSVLQGLWQAAGIAVPVHGAGTVKDIEEFLS